MSSPGAAHQSKLKQLYKLAAISRTGPTVLQELLDAALTQVESEFRTLLAEGKQTDRDQGVIRGLAYVKGKGRSNKRQKFGHEGQVPSCM